MRTLTRLRSYLLLVPLFALIFIQSVGGHVHVCLDGEEARISVQTTSHLDDFFTDDVADKHHEPASDVDLEGSWLVPKTHTLDQSTPIALFAASIAPIIIFVARESYALPPDTTLLRTSLEQLRPPLRGPPSISVA